MKKNFLRTLIVFLCFLLPSFPFARVVDPTGPRNPTLSALAPSLSEYGIDVRLGSNESTRVPSRPQLMPLENFRSTVTANMTSSKFASLFIQGVHFESALFAVNDSTGRTYTDPRAFRSRWSDVSTNQRVFVSFSSVNSRVANSVVTAFQSAGYSTFVYTGQDAFGRFNAVDTGNYFRQAGHKFVLDSATARTSNAVAVEAYLARNGGNAFPPGLLNRPTGGPSLRPQRDGSPCCKLCRYRNGILMGCDPPTCGPQCRSAR